MTKTFLKGALVAAVAFTATPALANPETFKATAVIEKPLTITKADDLNFGTITMGATLTAAGADVTLSASDAATAVCDGTLLLCSGTSNPAKFDVTGVGDLVADLSYDTNPTVLTNTDPLVGGTVAFELDGASTVSLTDGVGTFYAGGKVTVTSATKPGTYEADFEVSADYQ